MEDVTLREARPPEFDAILALWELMEERHTSLPDRREYLEALHRFAPDLFLVAEARGKPIGTIVGGWDGWRGHMARLAVSPYLRRSGVARSLVNEAEKRLRKRGAKRIYALIDRRNELGKSFWAAAGYTVNDDLVLYTKNIELDEEPG